MIQLQVLNKILSSGDAGFLLMNNINESFFSDYTNEFNYIKTFLLFSKKKKKTSYFLRLVMIGI